MVEYHPTVNISLNLELITLLSIYLNANLWRKSLGQPRYTITQVPAARVSVVL